MGFKDVFKNSFIRNYSLGNMGTGDIVLALMAALLLAVYIFFIYRLITKKTFYDKRFNIALVALALITAAIIISIQSSVVISLGMVGALSIVRFRTAIKDPMDLVFLFWSISVGIICGAGLFVVAVLVSLVVTASLFILDKVPIAKAPMILVVNSSNIDGEGEIMDVVDEYSAYSRVKSRNMNAASLDMVIEVRVKEDASLIREINRLEGVESVSLLSHDGEVTY